MEPLLPELTLAQRGAFLFGMMLLRYLLFAGGTFLVFYLWKRRAWVRMRIQPRFPDAAQYRREIVWSMSTLVIFALVGLLTFLLGRAGYTQLYLRIGDRSIGWLIISTFLLILLHDTWFYWMHRFLHLPGVFSIAHRTHHRSITPSPWAAFAFHPLEAVLEAAIVPIGVFLIPLHPLAIGLFLLWMILFNVLGHLGYELFPKGFTRHPLGRWSNTSTHHDMHHRFTHCNYGLYFNFWDWLMGTNHKRYHEYFEQVAARRDAAPES
ncbi:MAG: sterol desaturase family protein [Bacteroidia bacterium]|nr:sterol desaturase family protein [Bacteroidia bacterium]